jgi:hypothetical protein
MEEAITMEERCWFGVPEDSNTGNNCEPVWGQWLLEEIHSFGISRTLAERTLKPHQN